MRRLTPLIAKQSRQHLIYYYFHDLLFILKDKISDKLKGINKNIEDFDKKLKGASIQLEHFKKKTENIAKLGNGIKNVGKAFTVGVTLPVVAMGGAMVKAAADIESMQQQLSTMLGSAEAGGKMFEEIKTMAAKTPFETKDLMSATNTMLGFGIAQEKVLPLMNQLGDISGGNADRFQSLALAFSQVSSAGKLQGQDLLQMINAGFNPLESIAKRTGKSVGYWKEQMSKGKVTVEMVEQAMKDATSEGGRFFGMMEKQSKTALGQWSTFQDNLNMVLAEFGKIILPTAIKGLQKLSEILEWINGLSPNMKKFVLIVMGIGAAIGPLLLVFGQFVIILSQLPKALIGARIGMHLLSKSILGVGKSLWTLLANPATWGFVAIAATVWGLIKAIEWLIKKLTILKGMKLSGDSFNLENEDSLRYWSDERKKMGAKEFNRKYDRKIQKAVNNYDKNVTNNTTNNNTTTNNNYYAASSPQKAKYVSPVK